MSIFRRTMVVRVVAYSAAMAFYLGMGGTVHGQADKRANDKATAEREKDIADLCSAANLGKTTAVLALLEKVGDANVRSSNPMDNKKTPLIKAIMGRHLETVKALVENGADIHYPDGINRYPMYFTHISSVEIMNYILSKGGAKDIDRYTCADEKNRYGNGKHVLGSVCSYQQGAPEMIPILVKAGADPNKKYSETKVTPLIAAIQTNKSSAPLYVKALIENKADVNLKDDKGVSPLQWAKKRGDQEIITMLEKAGAKE